MGPTRWRRSCRRATAKPEAVITPTPHTESLETYAHWAAITRQALEDLPRIRSIVETQLRGGLLRKIEADTAAALTAETGFTEVTNPDLIAGIRIAIGTVQDAGYAQPVDGGAQPGRLGRRSTWP